MKVRFSAVAFCLAAALVVTGVLLAQSPPRRSVHAEQAVPYRYQGRDRPSIKHHLRLKRDAEGQPIALQTSIARYVPERGQGDLVVDLISAVHIADRAYYQRLNKLFEQYDVLLYELVAPPDEQTPEKDRDSDNPLRMIQKLSQSVLDLEHQLDHIDYTKPNFVHADMSPKQMGEAMRQRGDNQLTLFLSMAADMLRQQNRIQRQLEEHPEKLQALENIDPVQMLLDPYGAVKLKRLLAEQFAGSDGLGAGVAPTLDAILIQDRNAAAMRVFQKQLVQGKRRIGIFYGAAHMPDFERRLVSDFGLRRQSIRWLTAWDLHMKAKSPAEGLASQLLQELLRP